MVVEGHTVGSKAIDVRSLYVLVTVTPQGVGALVVRKRKIRLGRESFEKSSPGKQIERISAKRLEYFIS